MFIHMSIHRPKPEHVDDLIASMNLVRLGGIGTQGLLQIGPWREVDGGERVVGIAIWESRRHWEEHVEEVFAVVADHPFDEWEAAPVERILLDDVGAMPGNPEEI
ncbi:antibiotic biosynthesis monooxygenase [Agromyces larvae]|uniref:Antibiotic biosynthesis monooxygenase n=1 Tax=Agromyces larvae TaxID=2929802 RepID=A0ABY4C089_9MICO|nr:antibiotic biosynthesis monooxygenase [Agromyces larvae]UOE44429.1 antibiotic biosynthesis monooxygenase [Agromyces larvae]